jgi:acetyl-CoA C-acetyltransferase
MREVVITAAVRTAIGSFGGGLSTVPAAELGRVVIEEALKQSTVAPEQVDEVIIGQILQAGGGQNPARQAAIKAGLPESMPSYLVNKLCGSGLKSICLGALAVASGESEVVVAGGMENMSQAPYLLDKGRTGYRLGHGTVSDSILTDALTDAFYNIHMGITAENIAAKYGISRDDADRFALVSQQRAVTAIQAGRFTDEVVPVPVPGKKGVITFFDQDEYPKPGASLEGLAQLKPAFQKDGVVTAGNASGINDGAAAVVLMSRDRAEQSGILPLAAIRGYASVGLDPRIMGMGPVDAIRKALVRAGRSLDEIELIELNEAFATQSLGVLRELNLTGERVNVNGGAIALGHPVGASGARVVVTLLHEMKRRNLRTGLAALCIGGGQGIALVVERS